VKELKQIAKLDATIQQIALAGLLSREFKKHGVTLTVVGGALVQYFSDAQYTTTDLDAILYGDTKKIIEEVMVGLGFQRTTTYRHFEHKDLSFVVEFPPAPIEIGSRQITEVNILKLDQYEVRILRVEDIMMDRIVAGVEWKDQPSLEQAKLLWLKNKHRIDLRYLKKFAKEEGYEAILRDIIK